MTKSKIYETISYTADDVSDDPHDYAERPHRILSTFEKAMAHLKSMFDEDHECWPRDKVPEFKLKPNHGRFMREWKLDDGHYVYIIYEKHVNGDW